MIEVDPSVTAASRKVYLLSPLGLDCVTPSPPPPVFTPAVAARSLMYGAYFSLETLASVSLILKHFLWSPSWYL